jgi:hypothetical protein
MRSLGKKGIEWAEYRGELKDEFDRRDIRYCEARYRNCWVSDGLGFAHVLRRRNFGAYGSEERELNIKNVALLCNICHDTLDVTFGEETGGQEIERIIRAREGFNFWEGME